MGVDKHRQKLHFEEVRRRVYGLMERFSSKAWLFQQKNAPRNLVVGSQYDSISCGIWDAFCSTCQTEQTYRQKLELWKNVYLSIEPVLTRYALFLVGSTMSGLGLNDSDVDMCLLVKRHLDDARQDALDQLTHIYTFLKTENIYLNTEMIHAKVPILKFEDANHNIRVDLNCNNAVGIRNTHLMQCYASMDWRVQPLVIVVKLWAKANNVYDAKRMRLSSYSLTLMVINYLQCKFT